MNVYDPREDTYLLADQVEKYAKGDVLEMGTGSGYISIIASKTAESVTAVDINPEAIEFAKKKSEEANVSGKIKFVQSDLFENVGVNVGDKGKFDLIFFNPPYLPNEEKCPDIALDGGPEGWEITKRFLDDVCEYLKEDSKVLLLFSSLSKKDIVEKLISENGFMFKELSKQSFFSEVLYVYLLERK